MTDIGNWPIDKFRAEKIAEDISCLSLILGYTFVFGFTLNKLFSIHSEYEPEK